MDCNHSQKQEVKQLNQKVKSKNVKSAKPKKRGDADMKNITYRVSDNRYIGRKNIDKNHIEVYATTQKECYIKLKQAINDFNNNKETKKIIKKDTTLIQFFDKWYKNDKEPYISTGAKKDLLLVKINLNHYTI